MSFTPYFMFSIGDYSSVYEGKNLSVLSATITRQAKSDGKPALVSFEINLRDIDRKLESELIYQYAKQATVEEGSNIKIEENVLPQIEFEYGIPKISESPKYKGSITKVGYEIENRYISLTLEGTASSVIDDYNNTGEVKVYKDMDIHEIVADIANMAGWEIGEITDCEPVYETNDSYSDKKVYRLEKGQGFREFIIKNLIPEAKELETGIGDFRLYFRVEDGKERVYFTPSK